MKPGIKFWLFYTVLILFATLVVLIMLLIIFQGMTPAESAFAQEMIRKNFAILFVTSFLLFASMIAVSKWVFETYLFPLSQLVQGAQIQTTVNPGLQLWENGGPELRQLAKILNQYAAHQNRSKEEMEERIRDTSARLEKEKNVLASLISGLISGVVICNTEGQILLYNEQARRILPSSRADAAYVGLGRSIFSLVDRGLIAHMEDELLRMIRKKREHLVSHLVIRRSDDHMLRARGLPLLEGERMIGFILIFVDMTRDVAARQDQDDLLRLLLDETSKTIANLKECFANGTINCSETHIEEHLDQLTAHYQRALEKYVRYFKSHWSLDPVRLIDLMEIISHKMEGALKHDPDRYDEVFWVLVDSYTIIQSMCFVLQRIMAATKVDSLEYKLAKNEHLVHIDLIWKGPEIKIEQLRQWQNEVVPVEGLGVPLTLKEIGERHKIVIHPCHSEEDGCHSLRFSLPSEMPTHLTHAGVQTGLTDSRPEFYDFDLFNQPYQLSGLNDVPLERLMYTVFDTETTGLDPAGGDEIIQIGAVRIVNNRLLRQECFDQLVNPKRSVPPESIQFHGIEPEMLIDQPTIEDVLPRFRRFVGDTVLVAHNAAFDMRFLKLKEKQTGVSFNNPVLDTLLLSAVVHPHLKGHDINSLAERFGLNVIGRHTALGDALMTAEILLYLIPFLLEKGIRTLADASEAAKKSYYARIQY